MASDPYDELIDMFKPIEAQSHDRLMEAIKIASWRSEHPSSIELISCAKKELMDRWHRNQQAPKFKRGNRVEVVEDILWWNCASAYKPPVGLKGEVLLHMVPMVDRFPRDDRQYDGLIPVRFRSDELGYGWVAEEDDPDKEFITYHMPKYTLKLID